MASTATLEFPHAAPSPEPRELQLGLSRLLSFPDFSPGKRAFTQADSAA